MTPPAPQEALRTEQVPATAPDGASHTSRRTADPEAAGRRAERRAARITAGVTELEQRLEDLLRGGLAAAEQPGHGLWEETAARMVDAQAPGLANRVRELGAIPGSGPGWPVRLLEEAALLHLLNAGWLSLGRLPEPPATAVRVRVGLPSSAGDITVRDHWLVLSRRDSSDGRLTTRRIWLHGRDSGRSALLLSFAPAGRPPQPALPVGRLIEAEITPHTGDGRLRADWGEQFAAPAPSCAPPPGGSTAAAVAAYGSALRADPWLESWPATLREVIPVPQEGGRWQLADAEGGSAVPVVPAALPGPGLWKLLALSGGVPVTVFGECGHRGFHPLTAWSEGTPGAVPLT